MSDEPEPSRFAVMVSHYDETSAFEDLFQANKLVSHKIWQELMREADDMWEQGKGFDVPAIAGENRNIANLLIYCAKQRGIRLTIVPAVEIDYDDS